MLVGQIINCENCKKTRYFSIDDSKCECGWKWTPSGGRKPDRTLYVTTDSIKPYYDVGVSREIESRSQIKRICAENGYVYGGSELEQQAKENRDYQRENAARGLEEFKDRIRYELS